MIENFCDKKFVIPLQKKEEEGLVTFERFLSSTFLLL